MGTVFKQRFPRSEIITAEFVNYADEFVTLRQRLAAAAAAAKKNGAGGQDGADNREEGPKGKGKEAGPETARRVGTVVFNSVFGNLFDQGTALERAAALLEVIRTPRFRAQAFLSLSVVYALKRVLRQRIMTLSGC